MHIEKLQLENWMGISQAELEFKPGINLIYGRNEIGKSSIIESIHKAILGDAASKASDYKDLITWGTEVRAKVDLHFRTSDHQHYCIQKSFPGGVSNLFQNDIKITEDSRKTQKKIFEILNLPEKTENFLHLFFVSQGNAINILSEKKDNPIDESTRSHIGNIIRETALKELQDFQSLLIQKRDTIFTNESMNRYKKGKQASLYITLLEEEEGLKDKLEELTEQQEELTQKLDYIEQLDLEIQRLQAQKKDSENRLSQLKTKFNKTEELEKKSLEFKPLETHYNNLLQLEEDISKIHEELPLLLGQRTQYIHQLKSGVLELKKKENQSRDYLLKITEKKKEEESLEKSSLTFAELKKDYLEIKEIEGKINESSKTLPYLWEASIFHLSQKLKQLSSQIQQILTIREDYEKTEAQIKSYPCMTEDNIKKIKQKATKLHKVETQLNSIKSRLKLDLKITPLKAKELQLFLKKDDEDFKSFKIKSSMEITDFQKSTIQYPDLMDIQFRGNLADQDVEKIILEHSRLSLDLKKALSVFNVNTVEELEAQYHTYSGLLTRKKELQFKMEQSESLDKLENQKKQTEHQIQEMEKRLNQDATREIKDNSLTSDNRYFKKSLEEIQEETITHRTTLKTSEERKGSILKDRPLETFEKDYLQKEAHIKKQRETISQMEPLDIESITQEQIDQTRKKINENTNKINTAEENLQLLESMNALPQVTEASFPTLPQAPLSISPHSLREKINNCQTRLQEYKKQKLSILRNQKPEEFKKLVFQGKDKINFLNKEVQHLEPIELKSSRDITHQIGIIEKAIQSQVDESNTKQIKKAGFSAEIKNLSRITETRNNLKFDYQRKLEQIKRELTDIFSLKLLLILIEEEKENASKHIFKPLEDRITSNFDKLIPNKYGVTVNQDFEINVSAKTKTGEFQEKIKSFLSQGTKEQLSFFIRLAIAEQLSQKEPQVLILDDSFVNTDNLRLSQLFQTIREHAREIQFLIFTCKQNDYLAFQDRLHFINLEKIISEANQ